ncbi:MAG: VanZ family protein [Bacteroidales bacterium]
MKVFLHHYWKTLCWVTLTSFLLFTPGEKLPKENLFTFDHLDKVIHYFLFLILAILSLSDEHRAKTRSLTGINMVIIAGIIILYASCTELIQASLIPERTGAWGDFLADVLGTVTGVVLFHLRNSRATA